MNGNRTITHRERKRDAAKRAMLFGSVVPNKETEGRERGESGTERKGDREIEIGVKGGVGQTREKRDERVDLIAWKCFPGLLPFQARHSSSGRIHSLLRTAHTSLHQMFTSHPCAR